MTDFSEIARRYIDVWNERDAERRRKGVADLWGDDGRYTDPLADVAGVDAIDALIGGVQEQFAGHVFRLAGLVDAHHDMARFTWELVPEGGDEAVESTVAGFDVVVAGTDGRLRRVHGFLDKVPA
jgi:SnoaL-like domain